MKMVEPDHFSILCLVGSLVRNATEWKELFITETKKKKDQNSMTLSFYFRVFFIRVFLGACLGLSLYRTYIFKFMRQFKSTVMNIDLAGPKDS